MHKLTQIEGNSLRTKYVIGEYLELPKPGDPFIFVSEGLEEDEIRIIKTSKVKEGLRDGTGTVTFRTENSTYQLEPWEEQS
jgi:hypothetical protein